jgi:hypothetical protein
MAAAAMFALLATLAGIWFASFGKSFPACRLQMVEHLSSLRLDFASARLLEVQEWLLSNRQFSGYTVPERLRELPSIGCKTWTWRGSPVAMICFSLGDGRAAHLFIVRRSSLPDAPGAGSPQLVQEAGWMTGSWTEGGFVYVIARRGDEASLKRLLVGTRGLNSLTCDGLTCHFHFSRV